MEASITQNFRKENRLNDFHAVDRSPPAHHVALGQFDGKDPEIAGDVGGDAGEEGLVAVAKAEAQGVEPDGVEKENTEGPAGLSVKTEFEGIPGSAFRDLGVILGMNQGEEERKQEHAGPEQGRSLAVVVEVAAENEFLYETCAEHGEEEEGGYLALLVADTEGVFACGFQTDEQQRADNAQHDQARACTGGTGKWVGVGFAGLPGTVVLPPEVGEVGDRGEQSEDDSGMVLHRCRLRQSATWSRSSVESVVGDGA